VVIEQEIITKETLQSYAFLSLSLSLLFHMAHISSSVKQLQFMLELDNFKKIPQKPALFLAKENSA
jgi:hypothetical protein